MTRVLLAEDDTSISEPLSRALRREGYQVEVTEDGPTTLGRALSDGIDLILLDIGLPELDGFSVIRSIRAREQETGGRLPVVAVTARSRPEDRQKCLEAGTDGFLVKPIRATELFATIDRVRSPSI